MNKKILSALGVLLTSSLLLLNTSCNLENSGKTLKDIKEAIEIIEEITEAVSSETTGAPIAVEADGLEMPAPRKGSSEIILKKKSFTVSFNPRTNLPNWVAWRLDKDKLVERESRSDHFEPDPELPADKAVDTKDYTRSGWDRGHMCPAGDNRWHWKAMKESFYMTNVCPQHHNLNRGDWKELEDKCRAWVKEFNEPLYIVCGPVLYKGKKASYIGQKHKVRVPEAFFKVVMTGIESGNPRAIGFLYKNAAGDKPLDSYVNSVDEIERITGYDFYPQLPDDIEEKIESKADIRLWK